MFPCPINQSDQFFSHVKNSFRFRVALDHWTRNMLTFTLKLNEP